MGDGTTQGLDDNLAVADGKLIGLFCLPGLRGSPVGPWSKGFGELYLFTIFWYIVSLPRRILWKQAAMRDGLVLLPFPPIHRRF